MPQSAQCSCLENPRDGGSWWAAIYGVAQSRTWLKGLGSSSSSSSVQTKYLTAMLCLVTQSCLTLCNLMDCSLLSSPDHGILQARTQEWVFLPYCRGSSKPGIKPRSLTLQADSLPSEPPGKPRISYCMTKKNMCLWHLLNAYYNTDSILNNFTDNFTVRYM